MVQRAVTLAGWWRQAVESKQVGLVRAAGQGGFVGADARLFDVAARLMPETWQRLVRGAISR